MKGTKMKFYVLCAALGLVSIIYAEESRTDLRLEYLSELINASNEFGLEVLKYLTEQPGNIFLSPISTSMLIGLLYSGARNETANEIAKVLHYPPNVSESFRTILEIISPTSKEKTSTSRPYQLEVANVMLIEKSFKLLLSYKEQSRKNFEAAVESISFSLHPEAAVESVNGWVAWKTKNKILKVLYEPLEPLTKLFLMNAVYFKGTWKTKFDQRLTTPDTFYNDGRIPKTVPMMRMKKKLKYGFNHYIQAEAIELPYSGDRISMLIVLPEKRDGLSSLENFLSNELLTNITNGLREITVQVTLPRFSFTGDYNLIPILKHFGIQTLFKESSDLSGISSTPSLYVSKLLHKCVVQVDEEGGEAAVITGVSAGVRTGGPLVPLFTADHPFLFFIRDRLLNLTLFSGRVTKL